MSEDNILEFLILLFCTERGQKSKKKKKSGDCACCVLPQYTVAAVIKW